MRFIQLLKKTSGTKVLEEKVAIREGKFQSVSIENNQIIRPINVQQLLSGVVNNVDHKLFTCSTENEYNYNKTLGWLKGRLTWPPTYRDSVRYGKVEVKWLAMIQNEQNGFNKSSQILFRQ